MNVEILTSGLLTFRILFYYLCDAECVICNVMITSLRQMAVPGIDLGNVRGAAVVSRITKAAAAVLEQAIKPGRQPG